MYCLDSASEIVSALISILFLAIDYGAKPLHFYYIGFMSPYVYKFILGIIRTMKFCEMQHEPFNYLGTKTTILAVFFNL